MKIETKSVGKDMINDVPRIPVTTAPADTIAIVDARIEDVISFDFWRHALNAIFLAREKSC